MASLLEAVHLRKTFNGVAAVDDVSFEVGGGEVFGLLGPNGAGKTTTMSLIAGLLVADGGTVRIDGREISRGETRARTALGFVPQELAVYPDLSARENLVFFGRLYGLRGPELHQQVDRALEDTGLRERSRDRVGTFSGGMKRRLNFGIGLLHRPRVLILDEPTVGVDPQSRAHLLDCVRRVSREGVAVVYASHYMEEVQAVCHRVGIMDHGRMLACDTLEALLDRVQIGLQVRVAPASLELRQQLQQWAEVSESGGELTATLPQIADAADALSNGRLRRMLDAVQSAGAKVRSINTPEPDLERLFLELTGKTLRD